MVDKYILRKILLELDYFNNLKCSNDYARYDNFFHGMIVLLYNSEYYDGLSNGAKYR